MAVQMSIILGWEGIRVVRIIGTFPFHFSGETREKKNKKNKETEKTRIE